MFKTETHLHVREVSPCGKLPAAEMVRLYHEAGYRTLFISDHFHKKYFDKLGDISWEEKVDQFLSGYETAKAAAEKTGVHILPAAELRLNGDCNDYLLYGIDEAFLKKRPDVLEMTIEAFYTYAKEHGVTVVQAHPCRDGVCIPTPEFVDGLEVYNSNPRHENFSEQVMELAQRHQRAMTAGSDAHRLEDVALSGVMTETEICTADDYVRALLRGELKMIKGESRI